MTLLALRDLDVSFGQVHALKGVSLHIDEGEILAIVGANGAGKSTLMRAIMGLVALRDGAIDLAGKSIRGWRPHEIARLGIAYVPEGRGTLKQLTVRENLLLGAFPRRWDDVARKDLDDVFARFPALAERQGQSAGTLSGGEQQMLVIGRALMSRPKLMLLDEPSLGLAPLIVARVFEAIAAAQAMGVTILLVEQNAHLALQLAHRAYVLETGRIVLEGTDLAGDPRVQEAFLGGRSA
jgi:branched-chain amino acid transport system ATP-binding protein